MAGDAPAPPGGRVPRPVEGRTMTKGLLRAPGAPMIALTGVVAYSHLAAPAIDPVSAESTEGGCKACSSCCAHELPPVTESAGCPACEKAKAAEETKTEVKDEK